MVDHVLVGESVAVLALGVAQRREQIGGLPGALLGGLVIGMVGLRVITWLPPQLS